MTNHQLLLIYAVTYITILVVLFFLKRFFRINYDSRTILWSTIAFIWSIVSLLILKIEPFADTQETNIAQKSALLLLVVLSTNAIIQFIFWIIYGLIRHRDVIKVPRFLFNIAAFIIVLASFIAGLKYIFNHPLEGLLVTSTLVSAIVGLALQSTLSNLFAGFALQIESPFSIDDWVNLGGHEGKVVSQNWRSITLLTRENHRISLTNNFVAEDKVINFSRPTRRQVQNFYISIDYSHPPNKVKKILEDLMNEIEEVELDQKHGAFVVDYMDSGIKYCLKYWLHDYADIIELEDLVLTRLWYKLDRHNIKVPYPITEVKHIMLEDDGHEKQKLDDEEVKDFLTELHWIKDMNPNHIMGICKSGATIRFGKDDLIVKQGDEGDSMFIILDGSVRVLLNTQSQKEALLAYKHKGEFFGEMSLLTGKPRTASIRANEDTIVLSIDKSSFTKMIEEDKGVLVEFVETLAKSESGIAKALASARLEENKTEESAIKTMVTKIWSYLKNAGNDPTGPI